MEHINVRESYLSEQLQLIGDWSWRIFFINILKDLVTVFFSTERKKIFSISFPHQGMNGFCLMGNQISYPDATARCRQQIKFFKSCFPVLVVTQMMQNSCGQDDIIPLSR